MSNLLPKMIEVRQSYPPSRQLDFPALLEQQFVTSGIMAKIAPGMKIAVGVGSRGIGNLKSIVAATIATLKNAGAEPFIIPAMGSHGGATPEGQTKVLAEYGVTPESMGVPIMASMQVRKIGEALNGRDVVFSEAALAADGIVVINRVKPHTDFHGTLGSGLQKMLTIGFGKQVGAGNAHKAAAHLGHEAVIRAFSQVILGAVPVLCGVAIIDDPHHETADVVVLRPEEFKAREDELVEQARGLMPRLPLDEIDLLIVDQIGKEISGTGMDTNVIGRQIIGYSAALHPDPARKPMVYRIVVRDLSRATNGNGIGIGLADFTTSRAVAALDKTYTYVNAVTSIGVLPAKIPIYFDSDKETIEAAITTLASDSPQSLRVVRILNTLALDRILVSEACLSVLNTHPQVTITGQPQPMQFDVHGNLPQF